MSQNPLIPAKPTVITLDTLPQLFAHNRALFGGWEMNGNNGGSGQGGDGNTGQGAGTGGQGQQQNGNGDTPTERPDGVSEQEWSALGDAGKQAIIRERERANAAERALAASRARPKAPANGAGNQGGGNTGGQAAGQQQNSGGQGQQQNGNGSGQGSNGQGIDIEAAIQRAVEAAVKPFQEREEQRETETAAERVRQAVIDAAKPRLHDATDALAGIDLASVVNDQGQADPDKVKSALDDLVTRKPHLAKATQRVAPPGIGGGAPAGATDAEKVKAALADMQRATGVRPPAPTSSTTN